MLDPKKDDLPIRQDRQQNIIIPNLTEVKASVDLNGTVYGDWCLHDAMMNFQIPVATMTEYMTLFEKASQQRFVHVSSMSKAKMWKYLLKWLNN